jgi:hypothetical protein
MAAGVQPGILTSWTSDDHTYCVPQSSENGCLTNSSSGSATDANGSMPVYKRVRTNS